MEVPSDSFSRTKMSMPVVQHESAVRFCRTRPPSTPISDVGAYLFEGARECLHLPVGVEAVRMGRESSTNLEQAALSFLSAIDPERGIDAALFLRRTGLVLASWTREGIRLDVVSVMAATMLASIDTITETLGGSASESVAVEGGDYQMVATKIGSKAFLVVIAKKSVARSAVRKTVRNAFDPIFVAFLVVIAKKSVARSAVRKTVRQLVAQLSKIASETQPRLEGTTGNPRVKVRPPR